MKLVRTTRLLAPAAVAAFVLAGIGSPALAQDNAPVTVQVNGQTLQLNPAPTEQAGRVFVPLRGVFENLGATVVYANGEINATGRGHNVSLHVGSTAATVDGQQQTLDVAPFIVGASTYVPLRFVSQALGAHVNYDGAHQLVAIFIDRGNGGNGGNNGNMGGPPPQGPPPVQAAPPTRSTITLASVNPARQAVVANRRPEITANFANGYADPNSLRISLDGLDITDQTSRNANGIDYEPPSPLVTGEHQVRITGRDVEGGRIEAQWKFTSGTSEERAILDHVRPTEADQIGSTFRVEGHTNPGAHVVVQAGVTHSDPHNIIGAILGGGGQGNSAQNETIADGAGNFVTNIALGAAPGSTVELIVIATDPRTGASAPRYHATLTIR